MEYSALVDFNFGIHLMFLLPAKLTSNLTDIHN